MSSPSSQTPSTLEDPNLSDVSSLDGDDFEIIDEQDGGSDSQSLDGTGSWLAESTFNAWAAPTTQPTHSPDVEETVASDVEVVRSTFLTRSIAEATSTPSRASGSVATLSRDTPTQLSPSQSFIHAGLDLSQTSESTAQQLSTSSTGTSAWILPDPTRGGPEVSLVVTEKAPKQQSFDKAKAAPGHQSQEVLAQVQAGEDNAAHALKEKPAEVQGSAPLSAAAPTSPGSGHLARPLKRSAMAAGEPAWAKRTRAWLQSSQSFPAQSPEKPAEHTRHRGLPRRQAAARRVNAARQYHQYLSLGHQILHWSLAALLGFLAATCWMNPILISGAIGSVATLMPSRGTSNGEVLPVKSSMQAEVAQVAEAMHSTIQQVQRVCNDCDVLVVSNRTADVTVYKPFDPLALLSKRPATASPRVSGVSGEEPSTSQMWSLTATKERFTYEEWFMSSFYATTNAAIAGSHIVMAGAKSEMRYWQAKWFAYKGIQVARDEWQYWLGKLLALWVDWLQPTLEKLKQESKAFYGKFQADYDATSASFEEYRHRALKSARRSWLKSRTSFKAASEEASREAGILYEATVRHTKPLIHLSSEIGGRAAEAMDQTSRNLRQQLPIVAKRFDEQATKIVRDAKKGKQYVFDRVMKKKQAQFRAAPPTGAEKLQARVERLKGKAYRYSKGKSHKKRKDNKKQSKRSGSKLR